MENMVSVRKYHNHSKYSHYTHLFAMLNNKVGKANKKGIKATDTFEWENNRLLCIQYYIFRKSENPILYIYFSMIGESSDSLFYFGFIY